MNKTKRSFDLYDLYIEDVKNAYSKADVPNPLYDMLGGSYPGRGVYKPAGGGYVPTFDEIKTMNVESLINHFDGYLYRAVQTSDLASWGTERVIKDFSGGFNLVVSGDTKVDAEEIQRRGTEALDDMPGAAAMIDLNPKNFLNPGEFVKDTVTKWKNSVLDYDDFERRSRAKLWGALVSDEFDAGLDANEQSDTLLGKLTSKVDAIEKSSRELATSELKSRIRSTSGIDLDASDTLAADIKDVRKDLKLVGIGYDPDTYHSSIVTHNPLSLDQPGYEKLKKSIIDFQLVSTSYSGREKAMDSIVREGLNAMDLDIKEQVYLSKVMDDIDFSGFKHLDGGLRDDLLKSMDDYAKKVDWTSADYQKDLRSFLQKSGVTDPKALDAQMSHIMNMHSQKEIVGYFNSIGSLADSASSSFDKFVTNGDAHSLIDAEFDIMRLKKASGNLSQGEIDAFFSSVESRLSDIPYITDARAGRMTREFQKNLNKVTEYDAATLRGFTSHMSGESADKYKGLLENHLSTRGTAVGVDGSLDSIIKTVDIRNIKNMTTAERMALRNRYKAAVGGGYAKKITGGDMPVLGLSSEREMLRGIGNSWFKYGEHEKTLGTVTSKGNVIFSLFPKLEEERASNEFDEIIRLFEKGDLKDVYLWNKFKSTYDYLTPSYWVKRGLKSTNYFGLSINNSNLTTHDGAKYAFRFTFGKSSFGLRLTDKNGDARGMFANNFKVAFKTPSGLKESTVTGGSQFKIVSQFRGALNEDGLFALGDSAFTEDNIQHILSLSGNDLEEYLSKLRLKGQKLKPDEIEEMMENVEKYRNWVKKYRGKLGLTEGEATDPKVLKDLFMEMHKRDLEMAHIGADSVTGITKTFSGPMDRVFKRLNIMQTWLADSVLGKAVNTFSNYTTYVREKLIGGSLKKALVRGLDKIFLRIGQVALSETVIGPIILKLLEPLIRFITNKIMNAFTKGAKAMLKGDFGAIFRGVGGAFNYAIKTIIYIMAIPVVIATAAMLMFLHILGGFSPVHPAIVGGSSYNSLGSGAKTANTTGGAGSCGSLNESVGSCFYVNWAPSTPSYSTADVDGHGSNVYWKRVNPKLGSTNCSFEIPSLAHGPTANGPKNDPASICADKDNLQTFYGYAHDVDPTIVAGDCSTVYLPNLAASWNIGPERTSNTVGSNVTINGQGAKGNMKITIWHLAPGSVTATPTLSAGDKLAESFAWGENTHIHLEMSINNTVVKPEQHVCVGGGPGASP